MNDSSFVLFGVVALFLVGLGWFLFMDEREFSQQDEDEAAANILAYQRRYNDRLAEGGALTGGSDGHDRKVDAQAV